MDYRSLNKTNLLSLAQNISKSKLLSKKTLKNKLELQQTQTTSSNLLYSNIITTKERSRSVNAMMSSLLKQNAENAGCKKENNKQQQTHDLSGSFCTNGSNTEETSTKMNLTQNQGVNCTKINSSRKSSFSNMSTEKENAIQFGEGDDGISVISKNESVRVGSNKDELNNILDNEEMNDMQYESNNNEYQMFNNGSSGNSNMTTRFRSSNSNINFNFNNNQYKPIIQGMQIDAKQQYTPQAYNTFRKSFVNNPFTPTNNPHSLSLPNLHNNNNTNNIANTSNNNNQPSKCCYIYNKPTYSYIPTTPNYNSSLNTHHHNINTPYTTKHYTVTNNTPTNPTTTTNAAVFPQNVTIIQLEDLIVLEEKLFHILDSFRYGNKPLNKICVEWWTFYTYSSFNGTFETLFTPNTLPKHIAHTTSTLELLSIILIYEILKDQNILSTTLTSAKNLINELHQNFLVVSDLILSRINHSPSNIWLTKIQNIILTKRSHRIYKNEQLNILKKNNDYISNIFKSIIRLYINKPIFDSSSINFYFRNITSTSIKTLNDFFRKKINQDFCKNEGSLAFIINETQFKPNIHVPYLPQVVTDKKVFTLVLDLDETLISFRMEDAKQGILKLRPYLKEFLTEIKPLYELIIFTAGTQEYADPILDAIEKNGKFFDERLYRHHAVITDNVFVKDLSRLGRDLSKVIIIDNMPHNFKLQKENGIFIKNFYGDDKRDTALLDLIPILKQIASNKDNDVRQELKKYEQEIFTKITTDLQGDAV